MTLGLANIRALLERLGNPQHRFRTVVVAGTNGKGSVTAMTASLLRAQGMRTGRYISPHVYSVTERIAIDDESVSIEEMERAAARVAALHDDIPFSYFEALTAIAFLVFAEREVEVAVLETGLGGRFDATNVTDPLVTVITSIALDHRRILGATEEEIVLEKLGILRPGVPLLIGDLRPGLREIVAERAARERVPLIALEELGRVEALPGNRVRLRTALRDYGEALLPFPGAHQLVNVRLAVGAAERVAGTLTGFAEGIASAYLPGRLERFDLDDRTFYLDVSHNDAALIAAADTLAAQWPRGECAVVLGMLRRKELVEAPPHLCLAASRIYLIEPDPPPRHQSEPAYAPHELYATGFHRILSPRGGGRGKPGGQSSLTPGPCDAILWNRSDRDDHWERLLTTLLRPGNPYRVFLVAGSHLVVEQFGRRLLPRIGG